MIKSKIVPHPQGLSTPILEAASRISRNIDVHPWRIKKRIVGIGSILILGLVGVCTTLAMIATGLPESEPARLLTMFLLLGSLAIVLASGVGLLVVIWSAYVYQYVQALEAKTDAANESQFWYESASKISRAATLLGFNEDFDREFIHLLVTRLQDNLYKYKNDRVIPLLNMMDDKRTVEIIIEDKVFKIQLSHLIMKYLKRDVDEPELESLIIGAEEAER